MLVYRNRQFRIDKKHALYDYCDTVTALCCNLENAVRFRQRQVLTAVKKDPSERTENENFIIDEITQAIPLMKKHYNTPSEKTYFYGYEFYNSLLSITDNPDYYAEGLPRQSAQQSVKKCVRDLKGYFASLRSYGKDRSKFTGKPELPGYHRKGGHATAILTNQDAVLKPYQKVRGGFAMKPLKEDRLWYKLKLPLTKLTLPAGELPKDAVVKEVKITPENGTYVLNVALQYNLPDVEVTEAPGRIASIDVGVDNLMAVANNCGLDHLLYKGGVAKSVNQLYNKKIAAIMSDQMPAADGKFVPTQAYYTVTNRRNDTLRDLFHKTAKHFIDWCVDNRIDTIVMGKNPLWKQDCDIKADSAKQNFVQLPFNTLREYIRYLSEAKGILYIEQEESYTSKASFVDRDYIPVYGKDDEKAAFSGIRGPKHYKGRYKPSGFRGLYQTKEGKFINSDLNGAANILRKAIPDAFQTEPDFTKVCVVRHPDHEKAAALKERQLKKHVPGTISHAKAKRLRRKGKLAA